MLALMLVSAGQPLFSEDAWWHLSMGEHYAASGPWLDADPLLYTATAPPAPAAWLFDLTLYAVHQLGGIQALRVLHATLVAGILLLAWLLLRRASGVPAFASVATAAFGAVSAYRLFQLRPHLFTIAAALLLFWLLVANGRRPSWRRVAAFAVLMALWTNLHGAFLLGPVLVAAAIAGLGVAAFLDRPRRPQHIARARRLTAALVLGLLATLANPEGFGPHRLYFVAGEETPALELVRDEWAPVRLTSLPTPNVPPSPLSWALVWVLALLTTAAVGVTLRDARRAGRGEAPPPYDVDPACVGVAVVSLAGVVSAVRLLWMAVFPLLLLGQLLRARDARAGPVPSVPGPGARWALAGLGLLLLPGFVVAGDWPMISRMVRPARYAAPYPAVKFDAQPVWFLRDTGLEGRLFNDYSSGNFLGYWLAPRLRVFVNGSLNFPKDVIEAETAAMRRQGARPGESFEAMLDRYGVDVFFGTGLPQLSVPGRPGFSTTTHLEGVPGWILVFRNVRSGVYLRANQNNRRNLQRVVDYYAREGVPFDPSRGFDPARVISEAPAWAIAHAVIPRNYQGVLATSHTFDPGARRAAQERLATVYAALGLYDASATIDRRILSSSPPSLTAGRRLVWALLREHRYADAARAAATAPGLAAADDPLSRLIVSTARDAAQLADAGRGDEAAARVSVLPVFTLLQVQYLLATYAEPEARVR